MAQSSSPKARRAASPAKQEAPTTEAPMTDIERLEACVSKLAVMTGQGNMLAEFGIKRWEPGKKDMRKYDK